MFRHRALPLVLLALGVVAATTSWLRRPEYGLRLEKPNAPSFTPFVDSKVRFDMKSVANPEDDGDVGYRLAESGELRWTGFLYLPRSGNYRLELESDDGSELWIGQSRIVDNGGKHPRRGRSEELYFERGWVPIRIDYQNAGGGAVFDLRWRLPSGYHTTTRLPRVYLRPERPQPLSVLDRGLPVGAAVLFGAAALARWGSALRRRLRLGWDDPRIRRAWFAGAVITVSALGIRLSTVGAQGETCEEWAYVSAGDIYFRNAVSLEFDAEQWRTNREHPPFAKLLFGGAMSAFGIGPNPARVTSSILGALTVLITFALAARLGGFWTATSAGLIATILPPILAHSNIGTLEATLAFLYTGCVASFVRGLERDERAAGWLVLAWLLAGLAVATKFTAGLLLPFLYVGWVLWHSGNARRSGTVPMPWGMYVGPLLGVIPVLALWPWLWQSTLDHLLETFGQWKAGIGAELYFGDLVGDRPRRYFLVWFLAVTPIAVVGASLIGLARAASATDRRWWLVLAWLGLPFLWSFVTLRQGGYRSVYPAFFPLAILAGSGVDALGRWLRTRHGPALATAVTVLSVGVATVRAAPYWHYSFSEVLGGTRGVYERGDFDIGFWAEGFDKGVAWLNENAEEGATIGLEGNVTHTAWTLRPDLRRCLEARAGCPGVRDYILRDTIRAENEVKADHKIVFAVRVEGAPIAIVYQRTTPVATAVVDLSTVDRPSHRPPGVRGAPSSTRSPGAPPTYRLVAYRRPFDFAADRARPSSRRRPLEPTPPKALRRPR